ncbi:MAG: TatD family hydrolase [Candidatus Paceibacteria bacterium]
MATTYIDAHCHVQFEPYDEDREALLAQMDEQGVAAVAVGCDLESSRKAVALAREHEHIYAAVGVHPTDTAESFDTDELLALAKHPKVVAIGECGLDYYRPTTVDEAEKERQKLAFSRQIMLAAELEKPLIIHARPSKGTQDAYHDVLALLREAKEMHPKLHGDVHFFVGSVAEAEAFVALGFTLSFTAVITFARDYDAVIRAVPLTSILAETDAPYVAPASRRGERNDPLAVIDVVAEIARIRGEDPESVRLALLDNTRRVFGLPVADA